MTAYDWDQFLAFADLPPARTLRQLYLYCQEGFANPMGKYRSSLFAFLLVLAGTAPFARR